MFRKASRKHMSLSSLKHFHTASTLSSPLNRISRCNSRSLWLRTSSCSSLALRSRSRSRQPMTNLLVRILRLHRLLVAKVPQRNQSLETSQKGSNRHHPASRTLSSGTVTLILTTEQLDFRTMRLKTTMRCLMRKTMMLLVLLHKMLARLKLLMLMLKSVRRRTSIFS